MYREEGTTSQDCPCPCTEGKKEGEWVGIRGGQGGKGTEGEVVADLREGRY